MRSDRCLAGALGAALVVIACGPGRPDGPEDEGSGARPSTEPTAGAGSPAEGGVPSTNGGTTMGGAAGTAGAAGDTGQGGGPSACPRPPSSDTASCVYLDGYRLMVGKRLADGSLAPPAPFTIRGVGWSPTGVGQSNSGSYARLYTEHRARDVPLIASLNANTIKTYDPFERNANGIALLDDLYARGIFVIMQVMASDASATNDAYLAAVQHFRHHPGILFWMVGNEFNYNRLYGSLSYTAARTLVKSAISAIHAADPDHPVAVGFGEIPSAADYAAIPEADVWAINLYPGLNFGQRFSNWVALSAKPLFVAEYGADAYDARNSREDQAAQAFAVESLTRQILMRTSAQNAADAVLGGTLYAFNDEWWKAPMGSATAHDTGGFENAIHPDGFANEEWWGLVDIERRPRQAYATLQTIYAEP